MTPCNSLTVSEQEAAGMTTRGIVCTTSGIPIDDKHRQPDGSHRFEINPEKQCPFDVFDRLKAAVDKAAAS